MPSSNRNGFMPGVHAILDLHSIPAWAQMPASNIGSLLIDKANKFGPLLSFHAFGSSEACPLELQQMIHNSGIGVHLYHAMENQLATPTVFMVTRLLQLACTLQLQPNHLDPKRPCLFVVSNDINIASALCTVRQAQIFSEIVLLSCLSSAEMAGAPTQVIAWDTLLLRKPQQVNQVRILPLPVAQPQAQVNDPLPIPGAGLPLSQSETEFLISLFDSIMHYCEHEQLIPRESVIKKRLHDNVQDRVDFEDFMQLLICMDCCVVEGESPQRIVWPVDKTTHQARKFACADFFQPEQRFSMQQTQELLQFLQKSRPSTERGRFGFAQFLSRHGPRFLHHQPQGIIVELVQWLLNNKILLFKKGRVSTAATFPSHFQVTGTTPKQSVSCPNSPATTMRRTPSTRLRSSSTHDTRSMLSAPVKLKIPVGLGTPSDRSFVPASVLPLDAEFNPITLLQSMAAKSQSITASNSHGSYPAHLPVFHFEHSNNTSTGSNTDREATWVSVCTLSFRNQLAGAHPQIHHYKSTQQRSTLTAKQESARRALSESLWILAFNVCMTELKQTRGKNVQHATLKDHGEIDQVVEMDRLLAYLQQPPISYELDNFVIHENRGARAVWQCTATVHFRSSKPASKQALDGASDDFVEVTACDGARILLPADPITCTATEPRKPNAKIEVALKLLKHINAARASVGYSRQDKLSSSQLLWSPTPKEPRRIVSGSEWERKKSGQSYVPHVASLPNLYSGEGSIHYSTPPSRKKAFDAMYGDESLTPLSTSSHSLYETTDDVDSNEDEALALLPFELLQ